MLQMVQHPEKGYSAGVTRNAAQPIKADELPLSQTDGRDCHLPEIPGSDDMPVDSQETIKRSLSSIEEGKSAGVLEEAKALGHATETWTDATAIYIANTAVEYQDPGINAITSGVPRFKRRPVLGQKLAEAMPS